MEDGDISNRVAPKLWFQLEGLILLPDGDPREVFEHVSRSRRVRIRDHYTPNTHVGPCHRPVRFLARHRDVL
jgi:hypothetical protein